MNPWLLGAILTTALLSGAAAGWLAGKRLRLRMPNAAVTSAVLATGSLGGPLLTYRLLGAGAASYVVALLLAGLTIGLAFWPMGEKQGEKEWL